MSIQLLRPFFQGLMYSISNLRLYNSILQQETYGKQSRPDPKAQGRLWTRFNQTTIWKKKLSLLSVNPMVSTASGAKTEGNFTGQFL